MAPVAPVMATINRCGVTFRSISFVGRGPVREKAPEKSEGHRVSDAPNLRRRPGSPSSRHLPRFQVDDAPIPIASCGPSKMLGIRDLAPEISIRDGITKRPRHIAAPSGYCSASRSSLASDSTVVPLRFHCPSVSKRRSPMRRPQGEMTRPIARKSPRSACS